ncbi:MAG: nucleotidyltransferase [Bacteroidetes bacterium]|nr:nucleotidyltransferase [Bacteroidota bacterium]
MILNSIRDTQLRSIIEELAKTLDITPTQYANAVRSYEYVGNHLSHENSSLAKYHPEILPQGSFLLNTMIRPINEDDELDIDLVCRLDGKEPSWTQYHLKHQVGDRLKANGTIRPLIKSPDGRRCWTLVYHEEAKFHMDILPALVGTNHKVILEKSFSNITQQDVKNLGICITDKELPNYSTSTNTQEWLSSNPFGYGIWFEQLAAIGTGRIRLLTEGVRPVPKFEEEKPVLKRVVQILKRHRDVMYGGDEHKPISIIITTLAARAYSQQDDLLEALISIVDRMGSFIEDRWSPQHGRSVKWIQNPVNDQENFADKWVDHEQKQINFYEWLAKLKEDFGGLRTRTLVENFQVLKSAVGERTLKSVYENAGFRQILTESSHLPANLAPSTLTVGHRKQPVWNMALTKQVEVSGRYKSRNAWKSVVKDVAIPQSSTLLFNASTNVAKPYSVYWQVVNTGWEARNDLRGEILPARTAGSGGLIQRETARYSGTHWIQCFIVKDNVCVAKSDEFFVTIE